MSALGAWETLSCEVHDGIALLTLDRPDHLNVMNLRMRDELGAVLRQLEGSTEVDVVVVTGAGDAFCAGGDVHDFVGRTAEELHGLMRDHSHQWFGVLWDLRKPTIAAVNGVAAGGGVNLAIACDFIVASERAQFGETFARVGLMPDLGGLFMLPRTVGLHRAKALCMTGELVDARQARELGLVYSVVPHHELLGAATDLAARLAAAPREVMAATKAALNHSFELSMEATLQFELYAQSYFFGTGEHRHRLDRFLGRQGPRAAAGRAGDRSPGAADAAVESRTPAEGAGEGATDGAAP